MVDRSVYDATYQIRSRSVNREKETVMSVPWMRWIAFTVVFYSISGLYASVLHAELINLFDPNDVSSDDPPFFRLIVENTGGVNKGTQSFIRWKAWARAR